MIMIKKALLLIMCLALLATLAVPDASALTNAVVPESSSELGERRRPQFTKDYQGYIAFPAPYRMEGIGDGIVFLAASYNVAETYTDVFANIMTGDLEGVGAGFTEFHIIPRRLFMEFTVQNLKKAMIQSYNGRGMDTSGDDYIYVGLNDLLYTGARFTLSFKEREFELYAMGYDGSYRVGTLREPDGTVVADTTDSPTSTSTGSALYWISQTTAATRGEG